ncbi:hypothetical protein INR49_000056 [Caranx melampygus]|nr:hypothetical protein INR49_000056 [Caranx melampygus]
MKGREQEEALGSSEDMLKQWTSLIGDDSRVWLVVTAKPNVQCVGKEDVPESNAVKAVVDTADCEATKRIIQQNPAGWCSTENCNLDIFQDGNQLGVTKTETPSSSGSAVLAGILVSGLLLAAGITVGYCKCLRKTDPKGVKLAEDACPVDPENQGNTLVSVAPLNPPPETQEKPSVNGESPEAAKTQPPPPTNGHSTAKTADTEL